MEQGGSEDMEALAITERFAEEIDKLNLSISEIARQIGEDHQRIRDVLRYKQRLPTDLLAHAATLGLDINYVLTGARPAISRRESRLLENYRNATPQQKDKLEAIGYAFAESVTCLSFI